MSALCQSENENSWEDVDFPSLSNALNKNQQENLLKKELTEAKKEEEEWNEAEKDDTLFICDTGEDRFQNVSDSCDPLCVNASSTELIEHYNAKKIENFDEIGISAELLRGIVALGFEKPSPIQSKAIMPFIEGHDLIAQAQSGTGKTATFSISVLHKIDTTINNVQAFVISHTQELANQTYRVLEAFAKYTDIKILLCSGSENKDDNIKALQEESKPHMLVCTPGRLNHMISKNYFSTRNVTMMILDEADQLFDQNFYDQIYNIYSNCHRASELQIGMYSATMSPNNQALMMKVVRENNFVHIKVEQEQLTLKGITQWYALFPRPGDRLFNLIDIFLNGVIGQVIVYCNRKETTEDVARGLNNDGIKAIAVNSDLKSDERKTVLKNFRSGDIKVLVCTNMLARGIDVQQVSLVINYDFPNSNACENYLHRVGRSGRFGRKGYAISYITQQDTKHIKEVEDFYKFELQKLPDNYANIISRGHTN